MTTLKPPNPIDDPTGSELSFIMIRRLREVQQEAIVERVPVFHQYQSTDCRDIGTLKRPGRCRYGLGFTRELPRLLPLNPKDEPAVFFAGIGDAGALVAGPSIRHSPTCSTNLISARCLHHRFTSLGVEVHTPFSSFKRTR